MMLILCINIVQIQNDSTATSYYNDYSTYEKEYHQDYDLYNKIDISQKQSTEFLTHINILHTYKENIQNVINQNVEKSEISIFSDGTAQKLLIKETESLKGQVGVPVQLIPSFRTSQILLTNLPYFMCTIFVIILIYFIFYQDMQLGLLPLYKSSKQSLGKLYRVKLYVFLSSLSIFILAYSLLHLAYIGWDISSLNLPIQMIFGFDKFPFVWSVLQFLTFQILFKLFSFSILGLLFVFLLHVFKNISYTFGSLLLILLVEFLIFIFIPINTSIGILKFLNLYYVLFFGFSEFSYHIFMGLAINTYTLLIVVLSLIFILMIILCFHLYRKSAHQNKKVISFTFQCRSIHFFIQQIFQLYVVKAGIIILVLLAGYSFYKYQDFSVVKNGDERTLSIYKQEYLGNINQEKLTKIDTLVKEKQANHDKLMELLKQEDLTKEQSQLDKLSENSKGLFELQQIQNEMQSILSQNGKEYVEREGYNLFFASSSPFSLVMNFILISASLCILTSILIASDFKSKMNQLYESTKFGKKRAIRVNYAIMLLSNIAIISIVLILFVLKIQKAYPLFDYNYSLNTVANTAINISLYWYLVIYVCFYVLLCYCLSLFTYYLSMKFDTLITVPIILCICVAFGFLFIQDMRLSPLLLLSVEALNQPIITFLYIVILVLICISLQKSIKTKICSQ